MVGNTLDNDGAPDLARDAWLTAQGYRIVRVWNNDVMENVEGVCAAIAVPRMT